MRKLEIFINQSISYKDRITIVTDLKSGYDTVMYELGFVHQHCTFHFSQIVGNKIFTNITSELNDYRTNLKKNNKNLSYSQIKKMLKEQKKELIEEMQTYYNTFKKVFEQEKFEKKQLNMLHS